MLKMYCFSYKNWDNINIFQHLSFVSQQYLVKIKTSGILKVSYMMDHNIFSHSLTLSWFACLCYSKTPKSQWFILPKKFYFGGGGHPTCPKRRKEGSRYSATQTDKALGWYKKFPWPLDSGKGIWWAEH